MRAELQERLDAAASLEEALAAQQGELASLLEALAARGADVSAAEARAASIQRAINACLYEKQKGIEAVAALTRLAQRFAALEAGKLPPLTGAEAARISDKLSEAETQRGHVRRLVTDLAAQHTDLGEVLDRVAQLVDIAPGFTRGAIVTAGDAGAGAGAGAGVGVGAHAASEGKGEEV